MQASPNRLSNHAASQLGTSNRSMALAAFRRAAALAPESAAIQANLAIALTNFGHYVEASRLLHRLVSEEPTCIGAWHAYGVLGLVTAQPEDAVSCFRACTLLDPLNGMYKFDLALSLLQAGRWVEGLEAYECRRVYKSERTFDKLPRWDGSPGKSIYVWAEQGIGDTFQFSRYLPLLKKISRRVVFALPLPLHALFEPFREHVELLQLGVDVTDIDCEVSLMSLARHLGPTPEEWPADPGLLGKHVTAVVPPGNLRVGLCWACNSTSSNYLERSVDFKDMLQLTAHAGADFYSLQVGAAAADIAKSQAQLLVTDLSDRLTDDWCATAAAIKSMDMVVSTDTSVAHLAAILGKPTVMLLARRDWWRWGNSGEKTPWYPTMTIIRQERPFSWAREIEKVSTILGRAAQARCAKAAA